MKTIFATLLLFVAVSSLAGGKEGGNGGHSVVCRDESEQILSVETLDLFEGRQLGRAYSDGKADDMLALALERLKTFPGHYQQIVDELALVKRVMSFVGSDVELELTQDALPILRKKGCSFEQLASYTDDGHLLVSKEIFDSLSGADKAAILLHEAIYSLDRKLGATDSTRTRRIVGVLLAIEFKELELARILGKMKLLYVGDFKAKSRGDHVATNVVIKRDERGMMISISNRIWCGPQEQQQWYAIEQTAMPYVFKISDAFTQESELSSVITGRFISFLDSDRLVIADKMTEIDAFPRLVMKRYSSRCMK
jgi:hypothetical protein